MSPGFDAPPGSEHPVREPRVGKMFLARLHSARISDAEILVRNISEHGLGARCKGAIPAEGEEIRIQMEAYGTVEGIVRWVKGNIIGVQLTGTLNPDLLNFADKAWDVANKPFDNSQVYGQFKPSQDFKRPGLKVR